jgi:TrmH family RNA methyltransferase
MITSTHNSSIKWIRDLQSSAHNRRQEGVFVVEGVRLVEEVFFAGWRTRLLIYTEELNERGQSLVIDFSKRGINGEVVAPHVMVSASDTQSPQGILAVVEIPNNPIPSDLSFIFIPDGISDPGNLGAMLRSAAAAGVDAVFSPPRSADVFAPKVTRSAMGAHFRIPIFNLPWSDISTIITRNKLHVFLADVKAGIIYNKADFCVPLALIIGSEAQGAGVEAIDLALERIHIPMPGGSESLNAATAAGILLFEVVRQRYQPKQ